MRNYIVLFFLVIFSINTNAQDIKQANSPYSYFGVGDLESSVFATNRAMGGYGTALRLPLTVNLANPASLSNLKRTTFETAIDINGIGLSTETQNQGMSDVGISYMSLAAPIKDFGGAAISFLPYSSVYYDIRDNVQIDEIGNTEIIYEGDGTIYQFQFSNGYSYKMFSLGFDVSYLFGNIQNKSTVLFTDVNGIHPYQISKSRNTGGWLWNVGIQVHPMITDKVQMIIGGTVRSSTKLNLKNEKTIQRGNISFSGLVISDNEPFFNSGIVESHVDLPLTTSFGIGFKKSLNWQVGIDYKFENWESTNIENQNATFSNRSTVSIGATFIPWKEGLKNFLNTTQYRFGVYGGNDYIKPYNQSITRFGFTLGAGFPISKRRSSTLNLSLDFGQRGTTKNNLIKENYLKAAIGVTLNDLWFIKPKYD